MSARARAPRSSQTFFTIVLMLTAHSVQTAGIVLRTKTLIGQDKYELCKFLFNSHFKTGVKEGYQMIRKIFSVLQYQEALLSRLDELVVAPTAPHDDRLTQAEAAIMSLQQQRPSPKTPKKTPTKTPKKNAVDKNGLSAREGTPPEATIRRIDSLMRTVDHSLAPFSPIIRRFEGMEQTLQVERFPRLKRVVALVFDGRVFVIIGVLIGAVGAFLTSNKTEGIYVDDVHATSPA